MKAAIIGGGHNGLVCAAYLAGAGADVTVFEKRQVLGGLCVTEELFPGYMVSSVASYFGMLRQEVAQELDLYKFGLEPYLTDPVEIVLLSQGRFVFTPREGKGAKVELGELDQSEMAGWQQFWRDLAAAAALVYPLYFEPKTTQAEVVTLLKNSNLELVARHVFAGSLLDLLSEYISDEWLMSVAATCTPGFANRAGSVFGCIHHGTARTGGQLGAWGFVKAGMGRITQALADSGRARGVKIVTGQAVESIVVESGAARAVRFADGSSRSFDVIVCNADPFTVFQTLLPPGSVDEATLTSIAEHEPAVSAGKVHLALKQLPVWPVLDKIGHNYAGVIVSAPNIRTVIRDSELVPKGCMPTELMLTMGFPSVTDAQTAPAGKHLLTVDIHYLPARLAGRPWQQADAEALIDRVVKQLETHCPGLAQVIDSAVAVTPTDLERTYNLRGAGCWHLPMTPEYLFENRKMPGCEGYQTPVADLFLCGASTYPGGNVSGAPGRNCAQDILSRHGAGLERAAAAPFKGAK